MKKKKKKKKRKKRKKKKRTGGERGERDFRLFDVETFILLHYFFILSLGQAIYSSQRANKSAADVSFLLHTALIAPALRERRRNTYVQWSEKRRTKATNRFILNSHQPLARWDRDDFITRAYLERTKDKRSTTITITNVLQGGAERSVVVPWILCPPVIVNKDRIYSLGPPSA